MGVTRGFHPALTVLLLFAGHFVHAKPTRLVIPLTACDPDAIALTDQRDWQTRVLWTPSQPATREQIMQALA